MTMLPHTFLAVVLAAWGPQDIAPITPPTQEECVRLAKDIEHTIAAGEPGLLEAAIDVDGIVAKVVDGVTVDAKFRDGFITGLRKSFHFGKQICAAGDSGTYKFLRAHDVDGTPWLLFRFLQPGGGLNYHDFPVGKNEDGVIKLLDCYIFMAGERLTETFRRGYVRVAAEQNHGLIDKLLGKDQAFLKYAGKMKEMTEHIVAGQPQKALEIFHELPAALQADKQNLLLRMAAAFKAGVDAEYSAAMAEFERLFPGDPALDLVLIDRRFENKEWEATLTLIDRLQTRVGGDAYLDTLRGSVLVLANKPDAAKDSFALAIEREPTLAMPYYQLLTIALRDRAWADVARLLTALEKDAGVELRNLEEVDAYSEFAKSDEYAAWKKARSGE